MSSQVDIERADLDRERRQPAHDPESEFAEPARICTERELDPELANEVAVQLTAREALGAHARDELGLPEALMARPLQAALASAGTFAMGALLPVLLAGLGATAAAVGGACTGRGALRVACWGMLAMAASAMVGRIFGTTVL